MNIKKLDIYLLFMIIFLICMYSIKHIDEAFVSSKQEKYIHNHHHSDKFTSLEPFKSKENSLDCCLSRKKHDDDFTDTNPDKFCNCQQTNLSKFTNTTENFVNSCKALIC